MVTERGGLCSSQLLESSAPEPSATTAPGEYLNINTETRTRSKTLLLIET